MHHVESLDRAPKFQRLIYIIFPLWWHLAMYTVLFAEVLRYLSVFETVTSTSIQLSANIEENRSKKLTGTCLYRNCPCQSE